MVKRKPKMCCVVGGSGVVDRSPPPPGPIPHCPYLPDLDFQFLVGYQCIFPRVFWSAHILRRWKHRLMQNIPTYPLCYTI